jgi:hypothetical protein
MLSTVIVGLCQGALPSPRILYARVSLMSDRSFTSYEGAREHVAAPRLADNLDLYWNQQLLDVLLEYPIQSDRSEFAIRLRVDRFCQNVSTAFSGPASNLVMNSEKTGFCDGSELARTIHAPSTPVAAHQSSSTWQNSSQKDQTLLVLTML